MVLLLPFLMNTSMGAFVGWTRAFRNQSASSACQEASAGSQCPLVLVIVFGSGGSCILLLLNVPRIHISAFMPVDKNTILNLECSFVFFSLKIILCIWSERHLAFISCLKTTPTAPTLARRSGSLTGLQFTCCTMTPASYTLHQPHRYKVHFGARCGLTPASVGLIFLLHDEKKGGKKQT